MKQTIRWTTAAAAMVLALGSAMAQGGGSGSGSPGAMPGDQGGAPGSNGGQQNGEKTSTPGTSHTPTHARAGGGYPKHQTKPSGQNERATPSGNGATSTRPAASGGGMGGGNSGQ